MSALDAVADRLGKRATRDAPLGARTTYRVGGTAAVLVEASGPDDLHAVAEAVAGSDVEVLVVGRGSNLLVADAGFCGVAVVLTGSYEQIDEPSVAADGAAAVRAGGAVALPVLARTLTEAGLVGLEWAVGVPGSVGGGVRMNAGAYESDWSQVLERALVVDPVGAAVQGGEVRVEGGAPLRRAGAGV